MKYKIKPCPICGKRQKIEPPIEGVFPEQGCKPSWYDHSFYVNPDLTVRKFTDQENEEYRKALISFVKSTPGLIVVGSE